MVDRVVRVQLVGDASGLIAAANAASSALRGIGNSSSNAGSQASSGANQAQSAWEKFKSSVAGQVAIGDLISKGVEGGFGLIKDGFKQVIDQGMSYEQNMNTLKAVTQASDDQMRQLSDTAKRLGNDVSIPGASAGDAADAMKELAKGGLEVDEAMAAAAGTLRLAAAAQVSGGAAATIQANALNAFALSADQAGHVADVLANVANKSSGEITDFASGMQQSSAIAHQMGLSIDDTATALGIFANAGMQGSDAGTSLRTMLQRLQAPTDDARAALDTLGITVYDSQGKFVGMQRITDDLAKAKGRLSLEEFNAATNAAFGADSQRAAAIIAEQGVSGWQDMADAVSKTGGAQEQAAAQSQGFTGALDRLSNAGSAVALDLYEKLAPALTQIADFGVTAFGWIGDAIGWFSDLPDPVRNAAIALGAVVALNGPLTAIGPAISRMVGTAVLNFNALVVAIRTGSVSMATFGSLAKGALAALGGPIGLAIVGVTTALSLFSSTSDDAATSTEGLNSAIDEQTGKLKGNAAQIIATEAANSGASAAYERLGGNVSDYVDALGGVPGAQEKVNAKIAESKAAYDEHQQAVADATRGTGNFGAAVDSAAGAAGAAVPSLFDLNKATDFLSSAQGTLAGKTDEVRLANAGAAGELAKTGDAAQTTGEQADKAAEKSTPFADALKEIKSAASEADANAQFLSITLLKMAGNTVPAEQQARANAAAFRAIGEASRDLADANDNVTKKQAEYDNIAAHLGTTLDGQAASATNLVITQEDVDRASRDVADAQAATQSATDKLKDAQDKAAVSATDQAAAAYNNAVMNGSTLTQAIQTAVDKMQEQRDQFIKSATDAGISEQAAKDLADQQGLIPANVRTTYEQIAVQDAINKAEELNRKLSDLDKKEYYYKVVGTEVQKFVTGSYAPEDLHAEGGFITGPGSGTSDSIRARLSNGEFVVRASQTAKYRDVLEQINTPGFAEGGLVGNKVIGKFEQDDWSAGLGRIVASFDKIMKDRLLSFGFSGGLNPSQNPSSFGWQRAAGIVPYAWNGHPFVGGVAGGTQGLWAGLMNALVPQIPGGLMAPIWAYENRNNVNSPGNASFHAYGLAADINAPQNPNGAPGDGRSGPGVIPAGVARSLAARFGMEWGGDFRGTPDPMHFEIHVSPGQIGAGGTINLGGSSGGSGVEQWRGLGLDVLSKVGAYRGLNLTPFIGNMLNQIRTESSGNPNAINNYDINAQRGDPSIGLLQVIGSTFRSALRGTPFEYLIAAGQRDPRASLTASTLYSLNRYGSLDRAWRGVAYENGGVLPPGFTMAYNGTGQNEFTFTKEQLLNSAAKFDTTGFAQALEGVMTKALANMPRGVHVDTINARNEGQALAEIEWALSRVG